MRAAGRDVPLGRRGSADLQRFSARGDRTQGAAEPPTRPPLDRCRYEPSRDGRWPAAPSQLVRALGLPRAAERWREHPCTEPVGTAAPGGLLNHSPVAEGFLGIWGSGRCLWHGNDSESVHVCAATLYVPAFSMGFDACAALGRVNKLPA